MRASFDHREPPASRKTGSTLCESNKPAATSFQPRNGVVRSGPSGAEKAVEVSSAARAPGEDVRPME